MDPPPSYSDASLPDEALGRMTGGPPKKANNAGFRSAIRRVFSNDSRNSGIRSRSSSTRKPWKPITLKAPILCSVIVISGGLIAVIQVLLLSSQSNDGILFSADINDLPISKSFGYLYAPTILAVLYSFLWSWIDLDAKRLEPYYQLSKECGASAEDSILLDYPFDFVASVPLKAIKRRHWPVFLASAAMVIIFWGVTPSQTGIFATDNINRTFSMTMLRSTNYLTLAEQQTGLTATYAQSVYNIAWLNESLPSFMTRDYMLAPFGPQYNLSETKESETWTGATSLYSVDVACTKPGETESEYQLGPCSYMKPEPPSDDLKTYSTIYIGYHDEDGFADYYLSQDCPLNVSHTFLIRWSSNTWNATSTTAINETALYCEPTYYQQSVNATILLPDKSVVDVVPLGPKLPLPNNMFNTTDFEWGMSSGEQKFANRGDYPTSGWPDSKAHLQNMDLDLEYIPKMAAFAIAAYQRSAADYLDPELLRLSYQAAYRLLFSRQLVDVLSGEFDPNTASIGQRQYKSQSVIMVPVFAYITEGLLGAVVLFAAFLLYLSITEPRKLTSDPANMASVMSLVADDPDLLDSMKSLDKASPKDLEKRLRGKSYTLEMAEQDSGYRLRMLHGQHSSAESITPDDDSHQLPQSPLDVEGVRPKEFRLWTGVLLVTFFSAILILFAVLYAKVVRENGLALPSNSRFVRQLVENYLPTAVATFIEPIWVVMNRLLCVLQPFEELRHGKAPPSRSVTVDYTSLPPQLVFVKAIRARHFILGAVCCMALLSNLLAVAFSGFFNEDSVLVPHATTFSLPLEPPLNGTLLTRTGDDVLYNRTNTDQFFVAMSNLTAGTPLSAWADANYFYMPFNQSNNTEDTWGHKATTRAYGAELQCQPLLPTGPNSLSAVMDENGLGANYSIRLSTGQDDVCTAQKYVTLHGIPSGIIAAEVTMAVCQDYLVTGWMRANATRIEHTAWTTPTDRSNVTFHSLDWLFLGCRGTMKTGLADVTVDSQGTVLTASSLRVTNESTDQYYTQNGPEIISEINAMFNYAQDSVDSGENVMSWHNDSYPSDFYNYLISKTTDSTRLLDPELPIPTFNETAAQFSALYSKLVAISISDNSALLFPASTQTAEGFNIKPETRIFISKPMFIITEVILGLYIIVSITVYVHRPWRILPRIPTTIASSIGYFAAGHAVLDLKGTSGMSAALRNKHVEQMGHRYGFGSFIGTDRKAHIGVERQPFIATLRKESIGRVGGPRARADGESSGGWLWTKLAKGLGWRDGFSARTRVREGGWI